MKMMNKVGALLLSAVLCIGMAAPAFAYGGEPVEEVEQPVLTDNSEEDGEVSVHYVDSICFKDLQGFLDKQPERHSVLMNLKEKCDAPECNPTVCRKARDEHEL